MSINNHKEDSSLKQSSFFKMSNESKYLYNIYKSHEFKKIYNLFDNHNHHDLKRLMYKLYLEFKEHEPYINLINIENSRQVIPIEKARPKITHILETIFSNTRYIDSTIVDYIKNNISKSKMISYENIIHGQTFTFNFITYNKININKLNNCVKAMLLILQVIINISNNNITTHNNKNACNMDGITITIFMTSFAKQFELNSNIILGAKNINSGLTYPCLKIGEIYIYRKHEFFKVFIHEALHSYNVDHLLHNNYNSNSYYQTLINTFNINVNSNSYKNIGLNEAVTEFWTFIIHIFVHSYYNSPNFNKLIGLFEKAYKYESIHSSFQVAKILHANKLNYAQFLTTFKNDGSASYSETSHVLSYIFFKTLLIYNADKVISSNLFNLNMQATNNTHKIDITINPTNNSIRNLFIQLRNYSLNNMAFTIINNCCTIYNKYYTNLFKTAKKLTVKREQSFKRYTKKQFSKTKSKKYLLTNLNFMLTNLDC
jgi:hypothetical protein